MLGVLVGARSTTLRMHRQVPGYTDNTVSLPDGSVCVLMFLLLLARATSQHREQQTYFPYLHNHEYFALDRVLLVSVGVSVKCRARATNTKH